MKLPILFGGLLIMIFLMIIIKRRKRVKSQKALQEKAQDKLREKRLEKAILNDQVGEDEDSHFRATPIEVNYDEETVGQFSAQHINVSSKKNKMMLQIREGSELAARTYMFDLTKSVHIGRKQDINDIVVSNERVSDTQCEIVLKDDKVCVRNIGKSGIVRMKRKRNKTEVGENYIVVKTGDVIEIANVIFLIEIINTN